MSTEHSTEQTKKSNFTVSRAMNPKDAHPYSAHIYTTHLTHDYFLAKRAENKYLAKLRIADISLFCPYLGINTQKSNVH